MTDPPLWISNLGARRCIAKDPVLHPDAIANTEVMLVLKTKLDNLPYTVKPAPPTTTSPIWRQAKYNERMKGAPMRQPKPWNAVLQ
jgi:hypothetical protein